MCGCIWVNCLVIVNGLGLLVKLLFVRSCNCVVGKVVWVLFCVVMIWVSVFSWLWVIVVFIFVICILSV